MVRFEGYERRIKKIEKTLAEYGFASLEDVKKYTLEKGVDVDAAAKNEDITPVTGWLKENIHKHGRVFTPDELLKQSTGESFNAKYYVDYLSEKFTDLYLK